MKIAFFEIKDWEKEILKKKLKNQTLKFYEEPLHERHVSSIKEFDIVSVFIYSKIDKNILGKFSGLKLIVTRSTGFDHIDLQECKKRKIVVCNIPYYGENTVAEHTFALILALSRNVHKSYMRVLRNDFSIEGLQGFDLNGKTLGVIGAGHIGLHVIRIAKGFGMKVIACDHHPNNFLAEVLGFDYTTMDRLLRSADIITLHLPYKKETHHLIDKKALGKIKKGAILINTSRGGIVDTDALLKALNSGDLGGAGLDVLEGEELIKEEKQLLHKMDSRALKQIVKDHLLLSNEKVVFTPHIAFYSKEALERVLHMTIEYIDLFVQHKLNLPSINLKQGSIHNKLKY